MSLDYLIAQHRARVEKWLADWFDKNLTVQNLEGRTDDELAALLMHDLYAAGMRVING